MNAPFKTCACCGRKLTAAEWDTLPRLGTMRSETEDGRPCVCELRNCTCDSTLAVELVSPEVRP